MTDGCEGAEPGVDWLLAALQEFQQELREARDERVSSSQHCNFRIFHFFAADARKKHLAPSTSRRTAESCIFI